MLKKHLSTKILVSALAITTLFPTASNAQYFSAFEDILNKHGERPTFDECVNNEEIRENNFYCRVWGYNSHNLEYEFTTAFEGDVPTRETARRFYEWNPVQEEGNGSKINAHLFNDGIAFDVLDNENLPRYHSEKVSLIISNENSWSDTLAAISNIKYGNRIKDATVILNNKDALETENIEIINSLLKDRSPEIAYIVGGEEVISNNIKEELTEMGFWVNRYGGKDRIETMINTFPRGNFFFDRTFALPALTRAYEKPGTSISGAYADTINASFDDGVLLTTSDQLHPKVKEFLENDESHIGKYTAEPGFAIYGGKEAISDNIITQIKNMNIKDSEGNSSTFISKHIERYSGPTRYHTAIEQKLTWDSMNNDSIPTSKEVIIVDGAADDMFKVAYGVKAQLGMFDDKNLVLTNGDEIPSVTADYLKRYGNPASLLPGNEHRRAICYASETACAKAREIMGITQ